MVPLQPRPSPGGLVLSIDHPSLPRQARSGLALRLAPGVYTDAQRWESMLPWDRYTLAAAALQRWLPNATFSHTTALHLWGLPLLRVPAELHVTWPNTTHRGKQPAVAGVPAGGPRFAVPARRYHLRPPTAHQRVLEPHEFRLTPLSEALALSVEFLPFADAVVVADAAARTSTGYLEGTHVTAALGYLRSAAARTRVKRVFEFADPRSESPGESFSRAVMAQQDIEAPVLQQEFVTDGVRDRADCWWPSCGVIGEFDGKDKYLSLGGSSRAEQWQTLNAERQREARLRSRPEVRALVRWTWDELRHPEQFARKLLHAGVPRRAHGRRRAP